MRMRYSLITFLDTTITQKTNDLSIYLDKTAQTRPEHESATPRFLRRPRSRTLPLFYPSAQFECSVNTYVIKRTQGKFVTYERTELFAFLLNTKKDTYAYVLFAKFSNLYQTSEKVSIDFEDAVMSALMKAFTSTQINGCLQDQTQA